MSKDNRYQDALDYWADIQDPNSLTNKLRKKYENMTISQFFFYIGN